MCQSLFGVRVKNTKILLRLNFFQVPIGSSQILKQYFPSMADVILLCYLT